MGDIFLSCSADWTVKLWHQEHNTPLHSFHADQACSITQICTTYNVVPFHNAFVFLQKSIFDVCWSPFDSTLFGCVSEGRIEIWNLGHSV